MIAARRVVQKVKDAVNTVAEKIKKLIGKEVDDVAKGTSKLIPDMIPDKGFDSFTKLKTYLGDPGDGKAWHHIVEQSQVGKRAGFAVDEVNNVKNVISIPHGSGTVHSKISAYYSSKFDFIINQIKEIFCSSFHSIYKYKIINFSKFWY